MFERQVIVVFGLHVLRILVMHLEKLQKASLVGIFFLVRLKMLQQRTYFRQLVQIGVRQQRAEKNKGGEE